MESNDSLQKEISVDDSNQEVPQKPTQPIADKGLDDKTETVSQTSASDTVEEISDQNDCSKADSDANKVRIYYSKEELIAISKLSFARIRPKCLDNAFNNDKNGLWNPEKWISSRSPNGHTSANKYKKDEKKATNDLKERVIDEGNDDIILSPQRGSFGTGCHVSSASFGLSRTANEQRNRDTYMDRNKSDENGDTNHRSGNVRRIGTGRVGNKERERSSDWQERSFEKNFERNGRDLRESRDRNDDYNDRRNRNRNFDRRPNYRNNRYENSERNSRYSRDEEEEPEWFTDGPASKLETIELKGFDDDSNCEQFKDEKEPKQNQRRDSQPNDEKLGKGDTNDKNEQQTEEFDVNAWMKTENWFGDGSQTPDKNMISSLDGISNNYEKECDNSNSSRFKRWFQENPNQTNNAMAPDSRKVESIKRNDSREMPPSGAIASNTQSSSVVSPEKLFELLKGSNRFESQPLPQPKIDPTKMINLAEIEANLPNVNTPVNSSTNKVFDKLFNDANRKSVNTSERVQNMTEFKGDATIFQTQNSNLIVPKAQQPVANAPSILDMLREEENKEAMADLHRNNKMLANQAMMRANASQASAMAGHNLVHNSQNSVHSIPAHMSGNQANLMALQNWQNNSPLMKVVRPNRPNNDVNDQAQILFQNALIKRQQQSETTPVRPMSINETIRANTPSSPARTLSNANFFTPTSVMRNMHSEKDKILSAFNEMTSESNSSQQKFLNDLLSKPSSMRPIVKSNNPIVQSVGPSMTANKHIMQSPLTSHSDPMSFAANPESARNPMAVRESQLVQQFINQNSSPLKSYSRPNNSLNANVRPDRPYGSDQNQMLQNRTQSPNSAQSQMSRNNIFQMFSQSNARSNATPMSINQMMALQHNSNEGRQTQNFPRAITAQSIQTQMNPRSKSGAYTFDASQMQESATTYRQQRPHHEQQSIPNYMNNPQILGQIFGEERLHRNLAEMPAVPLKNALTLEDIERA